MTEPLAYLNGRYIPTSQMAVPVWDAGFVQGVTVAEQLRTFGGKLFQLERHLDRLAHSLEIIGVQLGLSIHELGRLATELAANNHRLLTAGDDLGLSLFITPGPYAAFAPSKPAPITGGPTSGGPTVGMHTYAVPFSGFAAKYEQGQRLVTTSVTQVPGTCWPAALKCRSRMHYYLADREARLHDTEARALLLDQAGFVSEASTANFVLYNAASGILSPPRESILPGVSIAVLEDLAGQMDIPFQYRNVTLNDVASADEAFLCSTSPCLLPVVAVDGQSVGTGRPGPMFRKTMHAWNQLVGLDIVEQAKRFAFR